MREIYLKPFEICVKDGDAHAVMVSWSFIGIKWSGENSSLINTVLRDEWGFEGFTLTDFFRNNGHGFMNADAALANRWTRCSPHTQAGRMWYRIQRRLPL